MNKTCIVSVAFRELYVTHSWNQAESLFRSKVSYDLMRYVDELPTNKGVIKDNIISEFQKSLYGFKPCALNIAIEKGYDKLIWLDPAVLPTAPIQILIDALDKYPMMVVKGDTPLAKMTNQKAKDYFGVTDKDIEGVNHIGGTIYCFNFNDPKTKTVFNDWIKAEQDGIFGTQDDHMKGHWCDESCMALAMHVNGMPQHSIPSEFTYLNQKNL